MTLTDELAEARRILGWVHHRTRNGCFSRKRSERDAALSDVNFWTQKYAQCWQSGRGQIDPNAQWFGETP